MRSWVSLLLLLLCFSFNCISGGRHRKHTHSPAILTGSVYCDTCFRQQVPKSTHFISGATVAVECGGDGVQPQFREEVKTNEKGEFEAKLPASVGKNLNKIKGCSVRLVSSSEPYCAVAATATAQDIHYKSKKGGTHVYSAGFFTFKPQLCDQKDFTGTGFPPSLPDPPAPFLPPVGGGMLPPVLPIPDLPIPPIIPQLPPLPVPVPGVPLPPTTRHKPSVSDKLSDQKIFGFPFPPNPFQPPIIPPVPGLPSPPSLVPPLPLVPSPPSLIPPLPLVPSPPSLIPPLPLVPSVPPPSLIPPLIPSPPPASLFPPLPLPPVPGLTPSPPPPPPAFPIPLPPIPKIPGLPPVPPASTSPHLGKTSP